MMRPTSYVATLAAQVHAARTEATDAERAVHGARERLIGAKTRSAGDFSALRAAEAKCGKAKLRLLAALESYFAASEANRNGTTTEEKRA